MQSPKPSPASVGTEATTQPPTLADVLYGGDSGPFVAEAQWVTWLHAIASSDLRALRDLFETTHAAVFTFISCIVGDRETAERLTVEVFFEIWRRAATFDPVLGSVLGWIMRHARDKAIHHLQLCQYTASLEDRGTVSPALRRSSLKQRELPSDDANR